MTISAANLAQMNAEHSARIYFIWMDLVGDPLFACTGTREYTFNAQQWLGIGEISGISEIVDAADAAARPLTITLSAMDPWIVQPALSRVNYKNRSVRIWRGFLDTNQDLVDDPILRWAGRMDVATVTYDQGEAIAQMTCEPLAARLLRANVSRYSDEDHRLRYPADRFFEYLPQMEKKDVLWGGTRVMPGQAGSGGGTWWNKGGTPWTRDKF